MISAEKRAQYIQEIVPRGRPLLEILPPKDRRAITMDISPALIVDFSTKTAFQKRIHGIPDKQVMPIFFDSRAFGAASGINEEENDPEQTRFLEGLQQTVSEHVGKPLFLLPHNTGTLNAILIDAETIEDSTEVIKCPLFPRDRNLHNQRVAVHNFYANISSHIPPLTRDFWINDEISGIGMPTIPKHPQYDYALAQAKQGDNTLLEQIINPNQSLLQLYEHCEKHELPLKLDVKIGNNHVDPAGKEWYLDEVEVEPTDLITTITELHILTNLLSAPEYDKQARTRIMKSVRELEKSVEEEQRATKGVQQRIATKAA